MSSITKNFMMNQPECPNCGYKIPLKIRLFANDLRGFQCGDCDKWLYRLKINMYFRGFLIILAIPIFIPDYEFSSIEHRIVVWSATILGLYLQTYSPFPVVRETNK